jgi:polysaccharide pyruvyl transferase WcaK-like protein
VKYSHAIFYQNKVMNKNYKQKIVVYGLFGQSNWGNEGTLKAALVNIHKYTAPLDVEVVCVCSNPEDVREKYGLTSFPIQCPPVRFFRGRGGMVSKIFRRVFLRLPAEIVHWLKGVKVLSGSDMVIAPGTGLLNDYATSALGRPYDILMWSILSKLCGCKLYFVSVGAGPIKSKVSRLFLRLSMKLSDYRSFRDEYSRNYIHGIGFDAEYDPIFPDLAFSLPPSMFAVNDKCESMRNVIGVGLKDYFGEEGIRDQGQKIYDDYLQKMGDFVAWLIDGNYKVRLLVGDSLYDEPVKSDLFSLLAERGIPCEGDGVFFDPVGKIEELICQLKKVDIIISPRFHNIIYGIMLGKPVISLAYHQKFAPVMKDLGMLEYCQDLDRLDVDTLMDQFRKLIEDREEIVASLEKKSEQYRIEAEEQYSIIFNRPPQ